MLDETHQDPKAVQRIVKENREHVLDQGLVVAVRGRFLDVQLDGSKKLVRNVVVPQHIDEVQVGWWVALIKLPRAVHWIALATLEDIGGGSRPATANLPQPADVTATAKPYWIELSWSGSFSLEVTYEIQHNSSASATGATMIKWEGSNYFYWCAPGVERYFRIRAVSEEFERSSWSDWVNATAHAGEAYMTLGINAGATAVEWQPFDWDLVNTTTGHDMVHDHSVADEGGHIPVASLVDGVQGDIIRRGAADWEAYAALTEGAVLIGTGADVVSDTTPTFLGLVTFNARIGMGGASGVNTITIPDGLAEGLIIRDGDPIEYLMIRTSPQLTVDFNRGGADIDIYLRSVGVDAMFIQGSDGAISLNGPSMDVVDGWWLGGGAAAGRLVFEFDTAPDQVQIEDADLNMRGNNILMPDNVADALHFVDIGDANAYLTFVTTDGSREVVVNQDAFAHIDFRVEGVGHPDALVVQGSDGQITLGALGLGIAHASAAGVVSSSTVEADELSMDIGDVLFNAADGLLLLNPDGKINDTEWWSLRKQLATLSGAFHQEAGRWLGTRGLVVEEATTNLILNPSIEVDTTGYTADNSTITSDTTYSMFGDASMKVVTDDVAATEGSHTLVSAETAAATEYTFSVYMRGSGTVYLRFWDSDSGNQYGPAITLTNVWTRYELTKTFTTGALRAVGVRTQVQQNITFYCDGFQLELQDYATSYCDGTLGTGYAWTGAAHGSTSTRTATVVNLDAHVELLSSNATLSFRIVAQMPYDADATWPYGTNELFDTRAGADNNNRVLIAFTPATDDFRVYINGGYRLDTAAQTFKAGDWVELLVTLDFTGDDYNIYVNGLLADNDTTALAAPAGLTLAKLGGDIAGGEQAGFNIAEFAVFDRVLTAIEVAGMYALQRPMIDAGSLDKPSVCNDTWWNDIYFPMSSGRIGGANQPTWAAFQGNTFEYTFAINDYIHLPSGEILHSYEEGSDIKLHVHIVLDGSDVGDTDVNYEIEYTIGDINEVMSAAAVVTSGDHTITGGTADRTHLFIQVGTIAGATYKMGAALKMRFRRIALVGGGNAPSNDPFALMVGAHIEEDTVGSRTETTK